MIECLWATHDQHHWFQWLRSHLNLTWRRLRVIRNVINRNPTWRYRVCQGESLKETSASNWKIEMHFVNHGETQVDGFPIWNITVPCSISLKPSETLLLVWRMPLLISLSSKQLIAVARSTPSASSRRKPWVVPLRSTRSCEIRSSKSERINGGWFVEKTPWLIRNSLFWVVC